MINRYILILGDLLAIGVITIIGFASHGETGPSYLSRMAAAFFPVCVMWLLIAPWFGLFQNAIINDARQLWRPLFVMIFAGPLAAFLRGFILATPVIPIFAVVLTFTSALGLIVWRAVYYLLNRGVG